MTRHSAIGTCLCLLSACAPPTRYLHSGIGPMTDPIRSTTRTIDRGDLVAVDLRMRDGSARIIASESNTVSAKVELTPHPDRDHRNRCTAAVVENANVLLRRVARTLEVRLESNANLRCSEHWTVQVPAGISVVAEGDVANLSIDGISSDVLGTVDVGRVTITGGQSSAIARVRSVGDASAESATDSYAEAVAKADVGKTELTIDGNRIDVKRAPGPGGRIGMKGSGRDRVIAETGVGDARVTLVRKSTREGT
jgi:hypothetical protein